jgi:hypothetical protein
MIGDELVEPSNGIRASFKDFNKEDVLDFFKENSKSKVEHPKEFVVPINDDRNDRKWV